MALAPRRTPPRHRVSGAQRPLVQPEKVVPCSSMTAPTSFDIMESEARRLKNERMGIVRY